MLLQSINRPPLSSQAAGLLRLRST